MRSLADQATHLLSDVHRTARARCGQHGEISLTTDVASVTCSKCLNIQAHGCAAGTYFVDRRQRLNEAALCSKRTKAMTGVIPCDYDRIAYGGAHNAANMPRPPAF